MFSRYDLFCLQNYKKSRFYASLQLLSLAMWLKKTLLVVPGIAKILGID